METKFTKGEWNIVHEFNVLSKNGDYVCSCGGQRGNMSPTSQTEMNKANAKLIAAAPDLFDSLSELLRKVKINKAIGHDLVHEIIEAEKAIKKATE